MGSFDYTCSVSGLPITVGDPVRYFLLVSSPYDDNSAICEMNDIWTPRTFPLRAIYDDYGSVEKLQEGAQQRIWFEGFKKDLIIKGVGDNSYHDVAVRHDMNLDEWLRAIYNGRVEVSDLDREFKDFTPSKGVPTIERMNKVFEENDLHKASESNKKAATRNGDDTFLIDELDPGTIRIRVNDYGDDKTISLLNVAQQLLGEEYATMIRAGTGRYASTAELIVSPKPLLNDHYNMGFFKDTKKNLRITQAMIREDVWQRLSDTKFCHWTGRVISKDRYLSSLRMAYDKAIERLKDKDDKLTNSSLYLLLLASEITDDKTVIRHIEYEIRTIIRDAIPFVVGLSTHFDLFCRTEHTKEEAEDFLRTIAEFTMVSDMLAMTRYYWKPSGSGPQFGEWGEHQKVYQVMLDVCDKEIKKLEEMMEGEE